MLDASEDASDQADPTDSTTTWCPVHHSSDGSKRHRLDDQDLVNLAVSFLGAGYETTANTISYTSYLLALNPDIQEKLQSEIDRYFEEKPVNSILVRCLILYDNNDYRKPHFMKQVMKLLTWTMSFKNRFESTPLHLCTYIFK